MATTIFSSPTAVGAKIITISTTVTNTSGAYSATINDMRLTSAMKAIKLELSNPEIFGDKISVNCSNAMLTISCNEVSGTSTVGISVMKVCDDPTSVTSTEFDILNNTIGDIDDLETSSKSNVVGAVNENAGDISDLQEGLAIIANGDTHASISSGQFVYVRNHATLPDGLYKATSTIGANAALTTSNLADTSGALNDVQAQITTLNNNVGTVPSGQTVEGQITALNSKLSGYESAQVRNISTVYFTERSAFAAWRYGRIMEFRGYFNVTTQIPDGTDFAQHGILSTPASFTMINIGSHQAYILETSGNGRLTARENIPTGYYYIIGSAWIDG